MCCAYLTSLSTLMKYLSRIPTRIIHQFLLLKSISRDRFHFNDIELSACKIYNHLCIFPGKALKVLLAETSHLQRRYALCCATKTLGGESFNRVCILSRSAIYPQTPLIKVVELFINRIFGRSIGCVILSTTH